MSSKRQRSSSPSPSPSSSPPASPAMSKLPKTVQESLHAPLICSLPPTCSLKPTLLASTRELESHYATYHSHVCEHQGCGCVFPDARLLDLHFAECHDPITALKKERGEKTFACHLTSCHRLFMNPKARRLHLIQAHGYPKEYFFAVTNKGIGGLFSKWGQAVSLIRGEWKPRVRDQEMDSVSDSGAEDAGNHVTATKKNHPPLDRDTMTHSGDDHTSIISMHPSDSPSQTSQLADAMSSLSLVPNKIRFGRGGKKGGFVHPPANLGDGAASNISAGKVKVTEDQPRHVKRRGGRKGSRPKTSEGTSSTSGDPDALAMQE